MNYFSKILSNKNMILMLLLGIILLGAYINSNSQVIVSVTTDKKIYNYGESVQISVIAKNPSSRAINLWFSSDYQADYIIDDTYQWSEGRKFLPILTFVVIAGNDSAVWSFTHTNKDYDLAIGFHQIEGIVASYGKSVSPATILIVPTKAKICIPDTIGRINTDIDLPMSVSTDSVIGFAQFIVEYNSNVVNLSSARIGPDASGFIIANINHDLPFEPTTPGTNENVLVQISGGGSHYFTGPNKEPLILNFNLVGAINDSTPLALDEGMNKTFLTTINYIDLTNGDILFDNGGLAIVGEILSFIKGKVTYYDKQRPVSMTRLTLKLINTRGNIEYPTRFAVTNSLGFYNFNNITVGSRIILTPLKKYDTRNAITGADALLILRYLAFLEDLTPDQKIAADINRDGKVNGVDAYFIMMHLAFGSVRLPVTVDYVGKWIFKPESIDTIYIDTNTGEQNLDFTAYLIGDITGNWGNNSLSLTLYKDMINGDNQKGTIKPKLFLPNINSKVTPKEKIVVPISIDSKEKHVNTILLSLDYNASLLKYESASLTDLTKDFMMAATNDSKNHKIHIAMAGVEGIEGRNKIVELTFTIRNFIEDEVVSDLVLSRIVINDIEIKETTKGEVKIVRSASNLLPNVFELYQNHPNPFNMGTAIRYAIPGDYNEAIIVTIKVYNMSGQVVATLMNERKTSGIYTIYWDGRDDLGHYVSSGLYFYTLEAGEFLKTQKMVLMR